MTTDVFARLKAIDPARDEQSQPDWDAIGATLLATIDGRTAVMPTDLKEQKTTRTTQKGWRNAWIGAVAFAAVIVAGVVVMVTSGDGGDVAEVATAPFETTHDAVMAFHAALEKGTAEEIHAMLGEGGSYDIVGQTVAETDERIRFNRAVGITSTTPESCEENSPTSITCEVVVTQPILGLLTGVPEHMELFTVRINDAGYISGVSAQPTPTDAPFDLGDEWGAWLAANGISILEISPAADSLGQLSISPEDAAEQFMAVLNRFLAERNG